MQKKKKEYGKKKKRFETYTQQNGSASILKSDGEKKTLMNMLNK